MDNHSLKEYQQKGAQEASGGSHRESNTTSIAEFTVDYNQSNSVDSIQLSPTITTTSTNNEKLPAKKKTATFLDPKAVAPPTKERTSSDTSGTLPFSGKQSTAADNVAASMRAFHAEEQSVEETAPTGSAPSGTFGDVMEKLARQHVSTATLPFSWKMGGEDDDSSTSDEASFYIPNINVVAPPSTSRTQHGGTLDGDDDAREDTVDQADDKTPL